MMNQENLNQKLIAAHAENDVPALVKLYTEASDRYETAGNIEAACFYLTHAYIFALEFGSEQAGDLHRRLLHYGRV